MAPIEIFINDTSSADYWYYMYCALFSHMAMMVFPSPSALHAFGMQSAHCIPSGTAVNPKQSYHQPADDVEYMLRAATQPTSKKYAFKAKPSEKQDRQTSEGHIVWQQPVGKQKARAGQVPKPCSSTSPHGPKFNFAALAADDDADGGHSATPIHEETDGYGMSSSAEKNESEFDLARAWSKTGKAEDSVGRLSF